MGGGGGGGGSFLLKFVIENLRCNDASCHLSKKKYECLFSLFFCYKNIM